MNYTKMYNTIYDKGYRKLRKNINTKPLDWLLSSYMFENILDVGCSYGENVKYFQSEGVDACGIEVAEKPLEKSVAENCVRGTALGIPFNTNEFEAVISTDVLEHIHVEDLRCVINEIYRVATKFVFIKVSTRLEKQKQWAKILNMPQIHLTVMPIENWISLFLEYRQFVLVEIKYNFLVFKVVK